MATFARRSLSPHTRRIAAVAALAVLALAPASCGGSAAPRAPSNAADRPDDLITFMRPGELGEYDLWAVRLNGGGLRRLTKAPLQRSDYNPDLSPDGSRILFERRVLDGTGDDLYTVQPDGTRLRRLTDCEGECWSDSEAKWSADGRQIVLGHATGPQSADGPSKVAIYVMKADGSALRQVSTPPRHEADHYPTLSPDGKTIVFQRDRSDTHGKLIAVDVASGHERVLYTFPNWAPGAGDPKFSPDGKRILFQYWCYYGDECPASTRGPRNARLATIRPDGTDRRTLRLGILADSGAWAPDGQAIAFRCDTQPPVFRLCTSQLDGRHRKVFPIEPLGSAHPDWGRASRP